LFDDREPSVEQPASFASLGALLDFGFQQCGKVGERGLLLAHGLGRERSEAGADRGEVQLAGVRLHQGFERLGLGRDADRSLSFPSSVGCQVPAASSWTLADRACSGW
jgi:hypothetical protein